MGELTSFPANGGTYQGYLAKSATGSGPGVIVLQEYWGLVGHIKEVADRFSHAGFTALAPDLYKGESTKEPEIADKLMMALNIGESETILRVAIAYLQSAVSGLQSKVGVVGFCMGGQLSLFAACANPSSIGACVDFYGIHPHVQPDLNSLQAPLLGIFAEHDNSTPPDVVEKLDVSLTELGKPHEFITYPGTRHAFFNNDRPSVYNATAAEDAWDRVVRFFRSNLV